MRRLFSILAVLAAAAGCEPAWSVQGHVQAADGTRAAVAAGSAVLRCPGETGRFARADRDGVFEMGGTGAGPSLSCVMFVSAPGRISASVELREVCEDPVGERCSVATVEVPLVAAR